MTLLSEILYRIPYLKRIIAERDQVVAERDQVVAERDQALQYFRPLEIISCTGKVRYDSIDESPWQHPFLATDNISRFRKYSDAVHSFAISRHKDESSRIKCAFSVNMAQSMYKWGCLAQKYGTAAKLFLHPQDLTALSSPEWEEFDGEYPDVMDGIGFFAQYPDIKTVIPVFRPQMDGGDLYAAMDACCKGDRKKLLSLLADAPGLRHEPLLSYDGTYPYFIWAKELSRYDVIYSASIPIAAYFSGRPYFYFAVGGDLQYDCGRGNNYGEIMTLSVNAARFLLVSNPHVLGHSRRLGFTNGVYLPYPMDSADRYCPGSGQHRVVWEKQFGEGVYVLTTSRLDKDVKGFGEDFLQMLFSIARQRKGVRFIFIAWGNHAEEFKKRIAGSGLDRQLIVLLPVGKKRLIDYYRSCDIVLDQLIYGYYGATALEAAAIGKPVVMKHREDHYAPLYDGDVAPISNVNNPAELQQVLLSLIDNSERRKDQGIAMRSWLVRNHGEETTIPKMLALLRLAADHVSLPPDIVRMNPLLGDETDEEREYHLSCLREVKRD